MTTYVTITAIFPLMEWEPLERYLVQQPEVKGLCIQYLKGFGGLANTFRKDLLRESMKLELYTTTSNAESLVHSIVEFLKRHGESDGIVATMPVSSLHNVQPDSSV